MAQSNKQKSRASWRAVTCAAGLMLAFAAHAQTRLAPQAPAPSAVPGEYIVKFRKKVDTFSTAQTQRLRSLGLAQVDTLPLIDAVVVRGPAEQKSIEATRADAENIAALLGPDVEYVEANYLWYVVRKPDDLMYSQQWALKTIKAEGAWDKTVGKADVVVGVVDTGIDLAHPDLKANLWTNPAETLNGKDDDGNGIVDDLHGIRAVGGVVSGDPSDDHSHGTHVAGTIGAVADNKLGVAGVSWRVSLMALKFLSQNGSGSTADAIKCIGYGVEKRASILNNSWGGGPYSKALRDAIAAAAERGVLFVAAAGNRGEDADQKPHYPSSYEVENVLSVMASDEADARAYFSNYGKKSVDVAAPGVSILSTVPGGGYDGTFSGTSMASPHVAGAAALVKSLKPAWTATQIKAHILAHSDAIAALAGLSVTGARLNLKATVENVP